jgi:hypothetical protein
VSVTVRDIAETISGLRGLALKLRKAAEAERVPMEGKIEAVLVRPSGLESGADFLDKVCDELLQLIPDTPIETLKEKD